MLAYLGSGPYCYSNALAMVLGSEAPSPAVIETLTGSPFGVQLVGGTLPLFDPYGWDPDRGLDAAVGLLGWSCERSDGGTWEQALARLRAACVRGPVLAGPLDMCLLPYQTAIPATGGESGASGEGGEDVTDHYVVVLDAADATVLLHDPQGHPYATLPTAAFLASWQAKTVGYVSSPYVLRTGFVRERDVTEAEALRRSLPGAVRWLAGREDLPVPAGTLGGAAAVEALAAQVRRGLSPGVRSLLQVFGVRVGARRLSDAAVCLASLGLPEPAAVAADQARILGSLQHPLVIGDDQAVEAGLRQLAPTYERLREALQDTHQGSRV
ncbi:hypothetical protein LHJ74_01670 [Streptomyces sp. N2-109]|uniref:Uncharacterized protein n=1 Tax=Streptomyces gossypii TaxID=2883101 RepID=A0ABT2JLI1_9ACTN|nr:hypothetical protein [Streptomyces gossypii]MCT2588661.1 hypothetical protein [Streptomyces gossypii]